MPTKNNICRRFLLVFLLFSSCFLSDLSVVVDGKLTENGIITYDDIGNMIFSSFLLHNSSTLSSQEHEEQFVLPKLDLKALVVDELFHQVVEKLQKNPTPCTSDFVFFLTELKHRQTWAIQGVLKGNLKWTGTYDECREIRVGPTNQTFEEEGVSLMMKFNGQYCQAAFAREGAPSLMVPGSMILNDLLVGLCLPDSCTDATASQTIKDVLNWLEVFIHPGKTFDYVGVTCPKVATTLDTAAIIGLTVLFLLVAMVVIGTAYERWQEMPSLALPHSFFTQSQSNGTTMENGGPEEHTDTGPILSQQNGPITSSGDHVYVEPNILSKILTSFSALSNGRKLLNVQSDGQDLPALHGIRFLSMAWIMLGHTFFFGFALTANPLDILDVNKHGLFFQAITQAVFAVDTFFLLSGCLLAYNFFLYMERNNDQLHSPKFWLSFYFRRIWRLTPTYAAILCVYVGLWRYIGSGPYWPEKGFEVENCKRTWWTNLLYVTNLVDIFINGTDGQPHREYCMGWTWYLSNDMQFFVLSPLVLYPLVRGMSSVSAGLRGTVWRAMGWVILLLLAVVSMAITGGISTAHNLPINLFPPDVSPKTVDLLWSLIYIRPWCRVQPYVVGIALAVLFATGRHRSRRLPKFWILFGWCLSAAVGFFVVFGLWPQYRGHVYSTSMAAFYDACSRFGWSLVVGWVIFACLSGNGGPVNTLLSCKLFVPLSRMTYCAYLIHPMIMYWYYFSLKDSYYYNDFIMTWFFGAFVLFVYMASFAVTLVFESPFLALNKIMVPSMKKTPRDY